MQMPIKATRPPHGKKRLFSFSGQARQPRSASAPARSPRSRTVDPREASAVRLQALARGRQARKRSAFSLAATHDWFAGLFGFESGAPSSQALRERNAQLLFPAEEACLERLAQLRSALDAECGEAWTAPDRRAPHVATDIRPESASLLPPAPAPEVEPPKASYLSRLKKKALYLESRDGAVALLQARARGRRARKPKRRGAGEEAEEGVEASTACFPTPVDCRPRPTARSLLLGCLLCVPLLLLSPLLLLCLAACYAYLRLPYLLGWVASKAHSHTPQTHTHTLSLSHRSHRSHRSHKAPGLALLMPRGSCLLDVESRGLPPLAPPLCVCGEIYRTFPYLAGHHAPRPIRLPADLRRHPPLAVARAAAGAPPPPPLCRGLLPLQPALPRLPAPPLCVGGRGRFSAYHRLALGARAAGPHPRSPEITRDHPRDLSVGQGAAAHGQTAARPDPLRAHLRAARQALL